MRRHLDRRMKLRLLRAAEAIAAQGSILGASRTLGITQPAVTRSLQELEATLELPLFERGGRGVQPTAAGEAVAQAASRIFGELRRLESVLDGLAGEAEEHVILGALPVAAAGVLPGVLGRLRTERPALAVQLVQGRTEELLPRLAAGELDLVVGQLYPPERPDGLVREALYEEPIAVLARAGHPIFARPVTAAALRGHELVLPSISQRVGQEIDRLLAILGLTAATSVRSTSYGFIREMLLSTDFVSVMPDMLMAGDLLRGTIRAAPLPVPAEPRRAGLIWREAAPPSRAAQRLVEVLRRYVAEIAARD
ncbi:LysR substrate-binding domain-containing protein [Roseomonas sp. BN140053]|uniref:LysR substrate-binding domain-containing protein n=1 Tax=Roseomonas sp. BN140053 TaxID=3391898 RepID=UPI0039EAB5FB